MQKAHKELGLSGIVENIHYGMHPSIISDLEKQAFFTPIESLEQTLLNLLERDYEKDYHEVKKATEKFSEAIRNYVPTNEDQYGGFRIGPAYPFWSGDLDGLPSSIPGQGKKPDRPHAPFGNDIYFGKYTLDCEARNSLPGVRLFDELKAVVIVEKFMCEGIEILERIKEPNDNLLKLILLAKFIRNHCRTVMNIKNHFILKQELTIAKTKENASRIIDQIEQLLLKEKENVLDTIPIVKLDSLLGVILISFIVALSAFNAFVITVLSSDGTSESQSTNPVSGFTIGTKLVQLIAFVLIPLCATTSPSDSTTNLNVPSSFLHKLIPSAPVILSSVYIF